MSIRVVTDSTCDLPEALVAAHGIAVVPCYINVDGRSYLDGPELSRAEFYRRLPGWRTPPTTATPGIGAFVEAYERLAAAGASAVLSIHIAGSLSNMANIARLAAKATSALPVAVFDSGQLSLGTGLLAVAAAGVAAAGHSLAECLAHLADLARRTYSFAALDTLEYLRRGGRVSALQSALGTLLLIKPLLMMHDNTLTLHRTRTRRGAWARLIELVTRLGPLERLAVLHAHAPEAAADLGRQARGLFPGGQEPLSVEVTPALGVHTGPGAVGLVCITASRT